MKKLHIAENLLKGLLLAGMLTACQNEEFVTPTEKAGSEISDRSAKTSALPVKLIEDGSVKLSYYKSGRDTGLLSKADDGTYTTYYSYGSGPVSDYWIYANTKSNATGLYAKQMTYHLINGRCISSQDITNNRSYTFTYGPLGRLDKIELDGSTDKQVFFYIYDPLTEKNYLSEITYFNNLGTYQKTIFGYGGNANGPASPVIDKYPSNNELIGLDKYLMIFGQFSPYLVSGVTIEKKVSSNITVKSYYNYTNKLNADGTLQSRWRTYCPYGQNNMTESKLEIFNQKYGHVGGL